MIGRIRVVLGLKATARMLDVSDAAFTNNASIEEIT